MTSMYCYIPLLPPEVAEELHLAKNEDFDALKCAQDVGFFRV